MNFCQYSHFVGVGGVESREDVRRGMNYFENSNLATAYKQHFYDSNIHRESVMKDTYVG